MQLKYFEVKSLDLKLAPVQFDTSVDLVDGHVDLYNGNCEFDFCILH